MVRGSTVVNFGFGKCRHGVRRWLMVGLWMWLKLEPLGVVEGMVGYVYDCEFCFWKFWRAVQEWSELFNGCEFWSLGVSAG
jgi:hypothetical protein